ncbi:MAG: hypothetical protein IKU38_07200 [Clostridia bacterium]|nr:hypothetical protein [Clostridia bacterium]
MGRSVVLKDLLNRPEGYLLVFEKEMICRVPLKEAAQMALLFSDGSKEVCALSATSQEQRMAYPAKAMRGCCIFRDRQLLYISDDEMRRIFAELIQPVYRHADEKRAGEAPFLSEQKNTPAEETVRNTKTDFPQRRWPPPPCWQAARYVHGRWQEAEKRRL